MSKMADYILDFLTLMGDHPEYNKHSWDWDNLPSEKIMREIMNKYRQENK